MHELTRRRDRAGDPDKTNPPTRVEELWGCSPRAVTDSPLKDFSSEAPSGTVAAVPLRGNDAMSLYWAARDCLMAGADAGAIALLRRLVRLMVEEKADSRDTREEAERLLALAELLLGRPHEPPSDRSADARDRGLHRRRGR